MTSKSDFGYISAVYAIMIVMSLVLVSSAMSNDCIVDKAAAIGTAHKSTRLGMSLEQVEQFNNASTVFGSFGAGMYALILMYYTQTPGARATKTRVGKNMDILAAVTGFLGLIMLLLSSIVGHSLYEDASVTDADKKKKVDMCGHATKVYMALAVAGLALYIGRVAIMNRSRISPLLRF